MCKFKYATSYKTGFGKKAYRDTETESWRKDGNWFWAIEEYSELSAHYFDVETGYPDFTDKTDKMQVSAFVECFSLYIHFICSIPVMSGWIFKIPLHLDR